MDSQRTAATFSALAHRSRVDVFKCLLAHHPTGLKARRLSRETGLAPSTLSHHLREMEKGGVIKREARGQSTITSLNLEALTQIASGLMKLCCSAESDGRSEVEQ